MYINYFLYTFRLSHIYNTAKISFFLKNKAKIRRLYIWIFRNNKQHNVESYRNLSLCTVSMFHFHVCFQGSRIYRNSNRMYLLESTLFFKKKAKKSLFYRYIEKCYYNIFCLIQTNFFI